jgi:hypothetical protein
MKNILKIFVLTAVVSFTSCEGELEIPIQSAIASKDVPLNAEFIETQVVSAYGVLDGHIPGILMWGAAASNWIYGEVASDNAYKGSDAGDQPDITAFERYEGFPASAYMEGKWRAVFEGVSRANLGIDAVHRGLEAGTLTESQANSFLGELRFLRGHYHFEAKKMWNNVPYIDETVSESVSNVGVDVWLGIEEDFSFAVENLSDVSVRNGGATSWSAKAYLAKTHMYQNDYPAAKTMLNDVINNGPYGLNQVFQHNFNYEYNNSMESVFAVQFSVNDGSNTSLNGNWGEVLNFPQGGLPGGCCGFFQPSQNLVNAYKTDQNGLPLIGSFNENDVTNDEGLSGDDSFTPYQGNLDPRLDWTVGRRGIPFMDWGIFPGAPWVRDPSNGGPYVQKKFTYYKSQESAGAGDAFSTSINNINVNIIRFAEVLLWRAEIASIEGDLEMAKTLVNQVRERAANPVNFVRNDDGTPAANYVVGLYENFPNQEFALEAVYFEHRLELALEGHRFFELVRTDRAAEILNEYLAEEGTKRSYLSGASFGPHAEYFPIPQNIINLSGGVLQQNSGY